MSTLQDLQDQRTALADQVAALDAQIASLTNLPAGWRLDPGEGEERDGITVLGQSPDGANIGLVMFNKPNGDRLVYIKNLDNGGRGKAADIAAMKAAVQVYENKFNVVL